jgi:tetratricopeptide (TPR) repeat protein
MQRSTSSTLETQDPSLSRALLLLNVRPTSDAEDRVALRYLELGVLDAAADHFSRASGLNRADAIAYEGLARIWRDWGFPELGLGDAMRAVYYAPAWPAAHNTVGTLLTALGRTGQARKAYERALALDPDAAYVLSNLCYVSVLDGLADEALAECRAALALDPDLRAARANASRARAIARP